MRQRLPLAGLPATPAFTRDYITDFARQTAFFHYNPHAAGCFAQRLDDLDKRHWGELAGTAELAAAQQLRWGGDSLAADSARALGQPGACMVVTGQQPGLFGGPAYSQLKALTAILLARRLAAQFPQRRFIPVFWIASADSDFDEVSRTTLIGGQRELHKFALRQDRAQDGRMLNAREIDLAQLRHLLAGMADSALPQGLYREDVVAALSDAYSPDDAAAAGSLVQGFARWMLRLFRGSGLVVLDPEPLLAQRADIGAIYAAQLERQPEAAARLEARGVELVEQGYRVQAEAVADDSHVFLLDDAGYRDKLLFLPGGGYQGKRSGRQWSTAELAGMARTSPGSFTGSVLFRPVIEEALFPLAAWVGGSAELAYRAQSTVLFELHDRRHAPAFLRHHASFIGFGQAELLDQASCDVMDIPRDASEFRRQLAETRLTAPLLEVLADYEAAVQTGDALIERVPQLLPELERSMRSMRGKLEWHRQRVERKLRAAVLRRDAELTARLSAVQALLYPGGEPQERVLNILSILPRTGFRLIQRLLEELEAPSWEHCLIMFD